MPDDVCSIPGSFTNRQEVNDMPQHTTPSAQMEFEFPEAKLCECECGLPAPIAKYTDAKRGWIKGKPKHFIRGHATRCPTEERFWRGVDKSGGPDSCWTWMGAKSGKGYGIIRVDKHNIPTHRVSWEIHNGPIPDGKKCLHRCDNPPCCNVAHLFLGSQADNMSDMMAKGRHGYTGSPGESHPGVKLTEEKVREIRKRYANGEIQKEIAKEYNVSRSTITAIVTRRIWKHVI